MRLFAGPPAALRPFVALVAAARAYALTPRARLLALPLTEDVHEQLHRACGTGEWLDRQALDAPQILLTSTDMGFAAQASAGAALAYLEMGAEGEIAAVWIDGRLHMKPVVLASSARRAPSLRPVNMALRQMGITAGPAGDEAAALGLTAYASMDDLIARGLAVRL